MAGRHITFLATLTRLCGRPHNRVTTITDLLEHNTALEDVQHLAGHADPRTTRLYDRRRRKITRNIVERISINTSTTSRRHRDQPVSRRRLTGSFTRFDGCVISCPFGPGRTPRLVAAQGQAIEQERVNLPFEFAGGPAGVDRFGLVERMHIGIIDAEQEPVMGPR